MSKIEKQDASTPEKKAEDGLAAKVRKMSETLDNVVRVLEKHFGVDLDKDGRSGFASLRLCIATALLSFVAMGAFALTPLQMTNTLYSIVGEGSAQTNALFDVDKSGNVRSAGSMTPTTLSASTSLTAPSATLGAATVQTNLNVNGSALLGNATSDTHIVVGNTTFSNAVTVGTTLGVTGAATLSSTLGVTGASTLTGQLTLAATQTVWSAAAVANTNAVVPLEGIAVRVNGTNYVLKLYPIVGP